MENHKENQTKAEQKHSEQKHFDPNQALNTLNDLYNRYASLKETIETNITERQRIQANKEEALKRIEATKDVLMTYLNRSFDERALLRQFGIRI